MAATSFLRCPTFYSGSLGDVFVHWGGSYSTNCILDVGMVPLNVKACNIMCRCGENMNYCIYVNRLENPNEQDGVLMGAEPDKDMKANTKAGSEIFGNFPYKGGTRPLHLMKVKGPGGKHYGLAYELVEPQATTFKESRIKQSKSRLATLVHEGETYEVMLRRDLDP